MLSSSLNEITWHFLLYFLRLWKQPLCSPDTVLGTQCIRIDEPSSPPSKDVRSPQMIKPVIPILC